MPRSSMAALAVFASAAAVTASLALTGCGMEASPMPPSLKLPEPVTDLSGSRAGNDVTLHWTMPKRDTEKVMLKGEQHAVICRHLADGPCQRAGEILVAPQAKASYTDHLPADLVSGQARLLVYTVELKNHAGKDAGPSNKVYLAAGEAPARVQNLDAHTSADGILLTWTQQPGSATFRIHRELVTDPKAKAVKPDETAGTPAPDQQTLELTIEDKGKALDRDAALDHTYKYEVDRVAHSSFSGHDIETTSAPSATVTLDARDVFPPHTPTDLQAVPDADAGSVDLSWSPNTDADIAGYRVYRRDAGSSTAPVRISPAAADAVVSPSFRDTTAKPGQRYIYSVSAIDHDGNESTRSAEVEEGLPQP
ncbi:fibronectin type III domain-containing protein [Silvibacterium sp.]|uniref:fibronectin type III domain-containing protein n=1 Tax=Silvibacterium sp. TaxID=1964179 RepID=UPI0039E3964F